MDRFGGPFPLFGCGYAGPMRRVVVLVLFVVAACTVEDGPTGQAAPTTLPPASPTTSLGTTTTAPEDASTATILIGPARYDLTAVCASGGAGEVEVSLVGVDVNGLPVVGYVRAFLREPYVSLQVGEGETAVLFEPRLEGVLPFELTDGGLEFPEVEFVTELDLESGEFVPAGVGSVEVECRSYDRELPPAG